MADSSDIGEILDEEEYTDASDVLETRSEVSGTETEETEETDGDETGATIRENVRGRSQQSQYQTPVPAATPKERGTRHRLTPDPIPKAFRLPARLDVRQQRDPRSKRSSVTAVKGIPNEPYDRKGEKAFLKPPKFEGKDSCIESHLTQFEIIARRNQWDDWEKADYLKCTLTGEANHILRDLSSTATYDEVVARLRQRYGSLDCMEACHVALKTRVRQPGETLSYLMKDIRSLFLQAYPGQTSTLSEIMARDAFVNALQDRDLMIKVLEREPATLDQAFKIAERMELYKSLPVGSESDAKVKPPSKVRGTSATDESLLKSLMESQRAMQKQIAALTEALQKSNGVAGQTSELPKATTGKARGTSHYCKKPGHYRPECPTRLKDLEESNTRSEASARSVSSRELSSPERTIEQRLYPASQKCQSQTKMSRRERKAKQANSRNATQVSQQGGDVAEPVTVGPLGIPVTKDEELSILMKESTSLQVDTSQIPSVHNPILVDGGTSSGTSSVLQSSTSPAPRPERD